MKVDKIYTYMTIINDYGSQWSTGIYDDLYIKYNSSSTLASGGVALQSRVHTLYHYTIKLGHFQLLGDELITHVPDTKDSARY